MKYANDFDRSNTKKLNFSLNDVKVDRMNTKKNTKLNENEALLKSLTLLHFNVCGGT